MRALNWKTLLVLLVACSWAQESSSSKWVELGYSNFAHTIQSHEWTCILLYDHWDERATYEHTLVMEGIADKHHARNIGFARLNARRHVLLRDEYMAKHEDEGAVAPEPPFAKDYYKGFDGSLLILNNETLLDVALGTPYWPAKFLLLAPDYNMYGIVDLVLIVAAIPLKIQVLDRWLAQATAGNHKNLSPLVTTMFNLEQNMLKYNEGADNSFNFKAYERSVQQNKAEQSTEEDPPAARNIRLLLEGESKDDGKASNDGYFTYRKAKVKTVKSTFKYLSNFGVIVEEYLAWVEGYETTWSEERKAREDEQTNFGFYMKQMNAQILALIDRVLEEEEKNAKKPDPQTMSKFSQMKEFTDIHKVPKLHDYFHEMVFGSGRSPHRMRTALEEMKTALGETAQERQRNRYDFNSSAFPMVTTMRDYMTIYAEIDQHENRYSAVIAELVTEWYNIMRLFHINLNQYYLIWLEDHPRPHGNNFQFHKMDVIDMEDPANFDILANYDQFHETYTKVGKPVILSNVRMTEEELTLDYIVSQCAASDVTKYVQVSRKVGERQAGIGWGGLGSYELEDELLNRKRRRGHKKRKLKSKNTKKKNQAGVSYSDPEYYGNDDDDDDDREHDRSLTMKQFSVLADRLDHLYLHDYGLPERCDRLLYEDTVYSPKQKIKIPSVIASWDLFQRLPQSKYGYSWPSLFVGRKGTNSKLHHDSGATGFFMYLVSGRKRWVVYNRDERVHLYEKIDDFSTYPDVLGIGKDEESDLFLSERFPLLHRAEAAYEIIQEPGQLVYIPPNCPHAVENLDDIVGLAMNIVPRDGVADHFHNQVHASLDFAVLDAAMNYLLFEDTADRPTATEDPLYATYGEYKAQY